ncbi:low temperature requirement protein A [Ilumatobacter sp.]|uniref:low temperature requirement protein A n=1 Tax=Ilumatobacter sp. TaxID=1967498 RepID=UPI003AF88BA3
MKGIVVPPREDDFTADPVELFFDLAFVFAFSRLVYLLVHEPNWTGVFEFALLFWLIWLPWTQFTWSANAVSGNNRKVRVAFLIGTVASVPMAASVTTAFDDGGLSFAIPLAVILSLGLVTLVVGLDSASAEYSSVVRYSIPNVIAVIVLIGGAFFEREIRIPVWLAAIAVVVFGTIRAGDGEWLVRPGHFAERHGLILIVALGEVIVAVGIPVVESLEEGKGIPGRTLTALVAAGAFACLMWWAYFDRVSPALEHRHEGHGVVERGKFARDVYTYGHIPIIAGVILMAAALEEITLHPKDVLPVEFRWMLFAGLVMFFGGVGLTVWRAFHVIARERVAALVVMVIPVLLAGSFDGLTLLVITDAIVLIVLASEHVRIERLPAVTPGPATDSPGT